MDKDPEVGDKASFSVIVDEKMVRDFAELSGDMNPLHMDESYASGTQFGGRVAHGMIVGALFSRLIGMHLPGKRSLYLSQTLQFHKPIKLGTEVLIWGEVTQKTDAFSVLTIRTTAEDANTKQKLVEGVAMVKLLTVQTPQTPAKN